jgi:hypothetical protein
VISRDPWGIAICPSSGQPQSCSCVCDRKIKGQYTNPEAGDLAVTCVTEHESAHLLKCTSLPDGGRNQECQAYAKTADCIGTNVASKCEKSSDICGCLNDALRFAKTVYDGCTKYNCKPLQGSEYRCHKRTEDAVKAIKRLQAQHKCGKTK